ncbi:hypothetical protein B0T22DRAFT_481987 [Podospora appendiculata]|uniref:Uncharacterized protein n=1 Tax=Podospora appendiculata TaxID=314037 RepID=A0AAE0X4M0_9PEZI|nr:hypothetical protein B0T22DRAFT_481987 [Podospora appendiculata]
MDVPVPVTATPSPVMAGAGAGAGADASNASPTQAPAPARKRSISGAGGLLSKFSFMRSSSEHHHPRSRRSTEEADRAAPSPAAAPPTYPPTPSFHTIPAETPSYGNPPLSHAILQEQQKTRRRRGSLRKVALLGRGAQRERREARALTLEIQSLAADGPQGTREAPVTSSPLAIDGPDKGLLPTGIQDGDDAFGLGISDITPRPSMDGYASRTAAPRASLPDPDTTPTAAAASRPAAVISPHYASTDAAIANPGTNYSTTDDEDTLHMAGSSSRPTTPSLSISSSISLPRPERSSISSGSESYFPNSQRAHPRPLSSSTGGSAPPVSIQRRRSTTQRATSPLALTSLAGLSVPPLPPPDAEWDYAETERWGWIILAVTWLVFVTGMGSCLGVWSWAWDVGTTPYAPPELEDDPTLPIVGYYPALIILTGVMAWVWVTFAWTGMKYFRHARVGGD